MRIPVRKHVFVVFELCSSKNGVSAREIERKYDLTPKSAWFLLMRIREGMGTKPPWWTDATVVVGETFFGPKVKRMNNKARNAHYEAHINERGNLRPTDGKTPVVTLINRDTGESYSRVVNDVSGSTLRTAINDVADIPTSTSTPTAIRATSASAETPAPTNGPTTAAANTSPRTVAAPIRPSSTSPS